VRSAQGVGSTFWFRVPLMWGESQPAALVDEVSGVDPWAGSLSGRMFLVVDDNELNQRVASELLAAAGARTIVAGDGLEALDALAQHQVDGVLMDVQMPVMDGLEATRRIREQAKWRSLPVIAMTANARQEDAQACREAGMDDFVTKPVVPGRLYATVVKWMQRPADVEPQTNGGDEAPTQPGALPASEPVQNPAPASQPAVQPPAEVVGSTPAVQVPDAGGTAIPELLDLTVLTQLTRRNPKMMREIATVFLAFMERTMNELNAALLAGDRAKLSALGHKAKSSAAAVGAMGLSGLCHRLESSMKDPTAGLDQAHHLVTEIRAQMGPIADKFARALA